ncbi:MAG: Fic family protein [Halioglobus sp.]|nr:Fic family protein [Halioglobus sp.]
MVLETLQKIHGNAVGPVDSKARYLHWDKLKHLKPPEGYTPELFWHAMRASRVAIRRELPFIDKSGAPFWFCMPDPLLAQLLWISEQASGALIGEPSLTDARSKQRYIINSLIDEAIYSSQLEGASTTRAVAREMIRTERKPSDFSEQMILNNYRAMLFIKEHLDEDITPSMIFALHAVLVEDTDIPAERVGVFRKAEDNIVIEDHMTGELLHEPPKEEELGRRLERLCSFINSKVGTVAHAMGGDAFLPPVLRGIIAHFMVGYDHPFYDGNGRTARALFYWVMAREGFWLMEHLSISAQIKQAQASYNRAYLHVETDGGDVTYFLVHQLDVVVQAIEGLKLRLREQYAEVKETERLLVQSSLAGKLNHRQLALLQNALKNPGQIYTVKSHQNSHQVAKQTARNDLTELADRYGLLVGGTEGRTAIYAAPADLLERINRV